MMYLVHQLLETKRRFSRDESGATAIEYGLLAMGISVAIIGTVWALGPVVEGAFNAVLQAMQSPPGVP